MIIFDVELYRRPTHARMHVFVLSYHRPLTMTIGMCKVFHCGGFTLTKKTGTADKPSGEAVQLKGLRNVVHHKGNVQGLYSIEHPALLFSESGSKTAAVMLVLYRVWGRSLAAIRFILGRVWKVSI